jgi:hypothetical protein
MKVIIVEVLRHLGFSQALVVQTYNPTYLGSRD